MRHWNSIHPKVGAAFLTALAGSLVAYFGFDASVEALLLAAVPVLAGYLWPEGDGVDLVSSPGDLDESGEDDRG